MRKWRAMGGAQKEGKATDGRRAQKIAGRASLLAALAATRHHRISVLSVLTRVRHQKRPPPRADERGGARAPKRATEFGRQGDAGGSRPDDGPWLAPKRLERPHGRREIGGARGREGGGVGVWVGGADRLRRRRRHRRAGTMLDRRAGGGRGPRPARGQAGGAGMCRRRLARAAQCGRAHLKDDGCDRGACSAGRAVVPGALWSAAGSDPCRSALPTPRSAPPAAARRPARAPSGDLAARPGAGRAPDARAVGVGGRPSCRRRPRPRSPGRR